MRTSRPRRKPPRRRKRRRSPPSRSTSRLPTRWASSSTTCSCRPERARRGGAVLRRREAAGEDPDDLGSEDQRRAVRGTGLEVQAEVEPPAEEQAGNHFPKSLSAPPWNRRGSPGSRRVSDPAARGDRRFPVRRGPGQPAPGALTEHRQTFGQALGRVTDPRRTSSTVNRDVIPGLFLNVARLVVRSGESWNGQDASLLIGSARDLSLCWIILTRRTCRYVETNPWLT